MRGLITIMFLCAFAGSSIAQQSDKKGQMKMWIVNGDTTITYVMEDFVFEKVDFDYYRIKRYVKNMYPYVLHCKEKLAYYDSVLATIDNDRRRRKFMRKANKELKEDFKYAVKDMSLNEGKALVKLLHKETGYTAYDIISKYRGSGTAVLYQGLSKTGGADLKLKYDPEGDSFDRYLKRITEEIDRGIVDVAQDPDTMTKEEYKEIKQKRKERNKKLRKSRRERKRKEREEEKNGDKSDVASWDWIRSQSKSKSK